MSKFSVKKPLTVFVAVVIVIVLGVVSYTRMTPTLLPNMDLPYVIVITTYPGASPEKVETELSKPMEESMATLENIVNVSSTSSENYSMIMLEFEENANLDAVSIDILQKVDQLEPNWDDMVGSPYIMKINPDMMPVAMAAVDMEGMDTAEMSAFVEDELLNKLEGITGVASVTASGLLDEQVDIQLSQEKIDALNEKVFAGIDSQFAETEDELNEKKSEMEDAKSQIDSGKSALDGGTDLMVNQIADAESQLSQGQNELLEGKMEIKNQIKELNSQLAELEKTETQLKELQSGISALEQFEAMDLSAFAPMGIDTLEGAMEFLANTVGDNTLGSIGMTGDMANMTGKEVAEMYKGLKKIEETLGTMGMSRADVPKTLAEITSGKAQMKAGITQLEAALGQLESGGIQLNDAMKELNKQKTKGTLTISNQTAQMLVGESSITMALEQMKSGLEQIEEAKETAYDSADLSGIITMDMVSTMLTAQNFAMPAGQLEEDGVQYTVSVGEEFESIQEMEDMLLFDLDIDGVDPIYLSDVADINKTDNSDDIYTRINGNSGVILSFSKQSNGATAEVSDSINKKFAQLEEEYDGLSFTNLMDQGDYIHMVVDAILQNLILGAVFAVLILFLFLKDIRPTFVTLCSIPISVLFAIVLMYFSGVTLNLLSLSGLAVAVGMLVDNSVVVIENIYRLRYKGYSAVKAAVSGTAQVSGAIFASTLTTVCVFMPIVFVEGLTSQLFMDFALTFAYALLASVFIALTLVPAMSSYILAKEPKKHKSGVMDKMLAGYEVSVNWALDHKLIVLLGAVALLVLSTVLTLAKGFTFMPEMGSDSVSVSMEMPEDATFEEATEMSDQAIDRIKDIEGVETVGAMMSSGMSIMSSFGGSGSDTSVTMYVLLDEDSGRKTSEIADEINEACEDLDCEIDASGAAMMDMSSLMGSGVGVQLYGEDLETLQDASREVGELIAGVKGIAEVDDGMEDANPGIRFVVNKDKAMKEGLTVAQVYQQIMGAISDSTSSTSITDGEKTYEVIVGKSDEDQITLAELKDYTLSFETMTGEKKEVNIRDIADVEDTESANSISRYNQRRYMTVSGELEDGYNVSLVSNDVEKALADYELPSGVTIEYSGENETIMEAMFELVKMLLLGILLVYLIMVAQFQSLKSPFIIMFTIPLAFTGGLLGLLLTGQEMSVISLIGFVMLVGIIVNNGIVLVEYINQLRAEGVDKREAMLEAGTTRMRPILMTSVTTILGLLVTAMSTGMGSDMMKPIAIVCIGGLVYATILTMYVVPCMYDILNRKKFRTIDEDDLIITED